MANYYHEARAQVKKLKTMSEDKRRKSERAAEQAIVEAEDPLHALRIDGRAIKLHRNQDAYAAAETLASMIPWNGDTEKMIDRFDGRALLDFYKEPDPRTQHQKSEAERELDELVNFEAFRDLVKMLQLGISEETAILLAEDENLEQRASAKSTAVGQLNLQSGQSKGPQPPSLAPAGSGQYGAVEFSYGGAQEPGAKSESGSEGSQDDDEDEEDSEGDEEADTADLDGLAANLGINSFGALLRRAEREEQQMAQGIFPKKKRRFSRKVAAQRARRMAGQGLGPLVNKAPEIKAPSAASHRDLRPPRRGSPTYDAYRRRSRSPSRSRSPPRRRGDTARTEFITEFKASKARGSSNATPGMSAPKRDGPFVDVLPQGIDPAGAGGPVSLPKEAVTMQGVRAHEAYYSYEDERRRERQRERERERERDREREKTKNAASKATPVPAVDKGKETPMERLKRLRAAQINKAFQKDVLTVAQRKLQDERDRRARETIERAAAAARRRSPSPRRRDRDRHRSRSPRRRRRSRSPSSGRSY